jgi:hypothetical protein
MAEEYDLKCVLPHHRSGFYAERRVATTECSGEIRLLQPCFAFLALPALVSISRVGHGEFLPTIPNSELGADAALRAGNVRVCHDGRVVLELDYGDYGHLEEALDLSGFTVKAPASMQVCFLKRQNAFADVYLSCVSSRWP